VGRALAGKGDGGKGFDRGRALVGKGYGNVKGLIRESPGKENG
jgi:hypothetical protein